MRLVLHIGATKTGSSALQHMLFSSRDRLAACSTLYSAEGTAASAHHLLLAAIHQSAWRLHADVLPPTPEDRTAYFRATLERIEAEAIARRCDTVVLSSEYGWGVHREAFYRELRDAFDGWHREVVAYLRRPDEWAVSSWLQAVKYGEARDFERWLSDMLALPKNGLRYDTILTRFDSLLECEKVHVLLYEGTVRRNVVAAFTRTIGIPDALSGVSLATVNPSPSGAGVEQLLAVNRSDTAPAEKDARRRAIMQSAAARSAADRFRIPDEVRQVVLEYASPELAAVQRRFLPHRPGPLFETETVAPAGPNSERAA